MTNDESAAAKAESPPKLALIAVCFSLVIAVIGLAYTATMRQPSPSQESHIDLPSPHAIAGNLEVSYMLSTAPNSGEASGSTIGASRVEFFPTYVLVTRTNEMTVFWPVDRLRKLEVSRLAESK